ncbi:hypothetical protein QUC31_001530 [Theobroma cacao]
MGEEGEDNQSPLLASSSSSTEVSAWPVERTGTLWTATAHVITGVIGAGVLSLAWSTAQLGWIAGPMSMLVFAGITLVSTNLLCDCYMYPDPEHGPIRIKSYMDAVKLYLGEKSHKVCGVIAQESLYGNALAYIITSASSIKGFRDIPSKGNVTNAKAVNISVLVSQSIRPPEPHLHKNGRGCFR